MLVVVGIPLCIAVFIVQTVCYLNWHHYGLWASIDTTSKNYTKALSLLVKAKTDHWQPYAVCPQDVRGKLYAISPAFAELRPFLDGDGPGCKGWKVTAERLGVADEYGPMFTWALREAVSAAGYYANAAKADAYYARLVKELKAAYAKGLIKKEPGLVFGGFTQPFDRRHLPTLLTALRQGWNMLLLNNWPLHFPKTPSIVDGVDDNRKFWFAMRDIGNINIPSADSYLPKPSLELRGWCFSPGDGQCDFAQTVVKDACTIGIEVSRQERPDVRAYFAQRQGMDTPEAVRSGFVVKVNGEEDCINAPLQVSSGGDKALIDTTTGKISNADGHILMHIDEFQGKKVQTSSLRNNLDNFRRNILERIAEIYKYASKWLALTSMLLLAGYLVWACCRRIFPLWPLPYISAALLMLCVLRMATIVLLHTVFGPFSLNWSYMSPAWVGMYGGIAVCLVWLCESKGRETV
ncbi:MAG: hypothetical protein LBH14_09050 [Desulfobulbaceae bacterium]|nr:hypothetical protein [Desulfobulbaceae bacterium]